MSVVTCRGCGTANTEFNAFCCACNAALITASDRPGAPDSRPTRTLFFPGEIVGSYEIERVLGTGGMGEVYAARDRKRGRAVALKVLSSDLAGDPRARQRMRREARAVRALRHPNIATIYDVSEHAGRPFIAMELLEGGALSGRFSSARLRFAELVQIGREIARALLAAHAAGIVHRDVKPANVVLTTKGQVKLVDFGLAKVAAAAADVTKLTRTGAVVGTMAYMAPEQISGEPVDHRADLWSLGVVLYQGLYGRLPFDGEGLSRRILNDALVLDAPPSGVPERFTRLLAALLQKNPDDRIGSAARVEAELARCAPGRTAIRVAVAVAVCATAVLALFVYREITADDDSAVLAEPVARSAEPSALTSATSPPSESALPVASAPAPSAVTAVETSTSTPGDLKQKKHTTRPDPVPASSGGENAKATGLPAKPF
jgi:serine/threonine protein kinase